MVYQPALRECAEGFVVSAYEALLRVMPNEQGINTFSLIQASERDGTMPALDLEITRMVCEDTLHAPDIPLWMNLSQLTLSNPDDVGSVAASLACCQCPTKITIELTESACGEHDGILRSLAILKEQRMKVVIDDIDDGYSLSNLLPSDFINGCKLSRRSTVRMVDDRDHYTRLKKLVRWCNDNQKTVVVEGIETELELSMARDLGADFYQGFYFARPVPFKELAKAGTIIPHKQ